ncbi:hypothetical protein [Demequina subtropica]|uniref:hypothetical protein n=1 Tax=Demequina subtropica TaxID=1638989 RepID=UPI000780FE0F|nr:hypothetical protein [Demequina subtropica]
MPLPLLCAGQAVYAAALSLCGLTGCYVEGTGWGRNSGTLWTVVMLVVAVALVAVPAALVPWHPRGRVRLGWSVVAALVLVGGAWAGVHPD